MSNEAFKNQLLQQIAALDAAEAVKAAAPLTSQAIPEAPSNFPGNSKALLAFVQQEVQKGIKEWQDSQPKPVAAPAQAGDQWKLAAGLLAQACLKPGEVAWLAEHVAQGAPGFNQFLGSESIKPMVQMFFEGYKEFLEGKAK